ncbi:MAG: DUF1559 domain-containing protein [Planctomycetaceae bacterium]|jgi:prepilin-type N-terminal cleavage/methylation domain-containing protein|nr:DUF1559 domain-containing protein [Planctomycetaceae bacterium]
MKTTNRTGFTLVELLVVISIISMLAGLLLPAIQAAREAGRRTACMSNQSNVAFALLNYDHTRGHLPPLRAPLFYGGSQGGVSVAAGEALTGTSAASATFPTELCWVGFLLPYVEQNNAWERIVSDKVQGRDDTVYELVLPFFKCKSSGLSSSDNRINYVANAGAQNAAANPRASALTPANFFLTGTPADRKVEYNNSAYWLKPAENKRYGVFFDHFAYVETSDGASNQPPCDTTIQTDYISANNGTSYTILISENIDAGHWIWNSTAYKWGKASNGIYGWNITGDSRPVAYARNIGSPVALSAVNTGEYLGYMEDLVAFCYPQKIVTNGSAGGNDIGEPDYVILDGSGTVGGAAATELDGLDTSLSPLFINEGRAQSGVIFADALAGTGTALHKYRTARPSSNHPGIVLAAFADRSVRTLKDDMNRMLFVHLCRPSSGVVVNPRDLD